MKTYTTKNKRNAEIVAEMATLTGKIVSWSYDGCNYTLKFYSF